MPNAPINISPGGGAAGYKTILKNWGLITYYHSMGKNIYVVSKIPRLGHQICYIISFRTSRKSI